MIQVSLTCLNWVFQSWAAHYPNEFSWSVPTEQWAVLCIKGMIALMPLPWRSLSLNSIACCRVLPHSWISRLDYDGYELAVLDPMIFHAMSNQNLDVGSFAGLIVWWCAYVPTIGVSQTVTFNYLRDKLLVEENGIFLCKNLPSYKFWFALRL